MELKLEDYAKREHRMWYEIMKEQTKKSHLINKLRMFVRPSSGWIEVWSFIPQEDGSKMGNFLNFFILNYIRNTKRYISVQYSDPYGQNLH